jgi:hypothetical protein
MSTSALLAFGLLLLDMSALSWRLIRVLCCGAVVNIAIFIAAQTGFRAGQVFAIVPDAAYRVAAAQENPVWGVAEFHPDYASLPDICALPAPEEMLHVPFSEARAGITVHTAFIGLRRAPIRFVSYKLDGVPIIFSGKCGDLLVFGPFEHSGNFVADESIVQALLGLRLLATLVIFAGAGALILSAWARRLVVAREKVRHAAAGEGRQVARDAGAPRARGVPGQLHRGGGDRGGSEEPAVPLRR